MPKLRRPTTSDPQRSRMDTDEPPTGRSSQTLQLYQTILTRFDLLTDAERTDLVELTSLFADSAPEDRALLLEIARRLTRG
jgi:hypothetical protein